MKNQSSHFGRYIFAIYTAFVIFCLLCIYFLLPQADFRLFNSGKQFVLQCIFLVLVPGVFILFINNLYTKRLRQKRNTIAKNIHRYEALSSATNDAIWDYDMQTGEVFHNEMLLNIFGYTEEEMINNTSWWEKHIHPGDKGRVLTLMNDSLNGNSKSWEDEYRFRCKNGTYKIVYDRSRIVRDANGKPLRLIGAMKDVTMVRAMEKEMVERQLKNKNTLTQKIITTHENDRKAIKHLLHEDVNQILASIKLYINSYSNERKGEDSIATSLAYLDDAMMKISDISHILSSSTFELFGLTEAIYELFSRYQKNNRILLFLETDNFYENNVSSDLNLLLYRIIEVNLALVIEKKATEQINIHLAAVGDKTSLKILFSSNDSSKAREILYDEASTDIKAKLEMYEGKMTIHKTPDDFYNIEITV
jgi:two-component system, NarL family, sensor histidine kinase UhpB